MPRIIIDKKKCVGCCTCEIVCTTAHEGRINPRHSRLRVPLTFPTPSPPKVCMQCKKPKCAEACPAGALALGEEMVTFDKAKCVSCGACIKACPFHSIWMEDGAVYKCDLCGGDPTCLKFCQFHAISLS